MPLKKDGNTIIKISVSKQIVNIYFKNNKISVPLSIYLSSYFYKGKTLKDEEIAKLKEYEECLDLIKYSKSILSRHAYSEYIMREKLYARKANNKQIDLVINELKKIELINDKKLTSDLIELYIHKGYGSNKIKNMLISKGLKTDNLEIFNSFSDECEMAYAHLEKLEKKYAKYSTKEKRKHVNNALIGLGFDKEIALKVSNAINMNDEETELNLLEKDYLKSFNKWQRKYCDYQLKNKVINSLLIKGYNLNTINEIWRKYHDENA